MAHEKIKDKELLNELQDNLSVARNKLGKYGCSICVSELANVRGVLNRSGQLPTQAQNQFFSKRSQPLFLDVIDTLTHLIRKIDNEGDLLEKEMRGTQNFSNDLNKRLSKYTFKSILRNELQQMVEKIYSSRPALESFDSRHRVVSFYPQAK